MNNEPVAWMALNELNGSYSTFTNDQKQRLLPHVSQCYGKWIPLYTHPVKEQGNPVAWRSQSPDGYWSLYGAPVEGAEPLYTGFKELTDEEIIDIWLPFTMQGIVGKINFAKAILRKAQEK